jgi:hypothetical protein
LLKVDAVCYNAQVAMPNQRICVAADPTGTPVVVQVWPELLKEMK